MLIRFLPLLAVWIASSFAGESSANDAASAKRTPMGFQGMRGKKDLSASSERDELSKRDLLDVQITQDKDGLNDHEDNLLLHDEFEKRVPMGFQGMRGKKDYFTPDFEDSYTREDYEKRAPMGFQGMRGKKSLFEEVLREIEKKAAIGFHGAREKNPYTFDYPQGYEKRFLEINFQDARNNKEELPADWEKRAPMGFQGMRGKKTLLEELEKRAVMGFQGMRGKKDVFENYMDYYMEPTVLDRRAPIGFQGMRGKKNYDKRAPLGFQGMRGKRNTGRGFAIGMNFEPRSSSEFQGMGESRRNALAPCQVEKRSPMRYFEIRGKEIPRWDLPGMFVGVRGKKWATVPYKDNSPYVSVFDNIERIAADEDSPATLDSQ